MRLNEERKMLALRWIIPLLLIGILVLWANMGITTKGNTVQLKTLKKDSLFINVNADSLYHYLQNSKVFKDEVKRIKYTKSKLQFSYDTNCNLFFHEGIAHDTSVVPLLHEIYTIQDGVATVTLKVNEGYAHVPSELLESILNPQY